MPEALPPLRVATYNVHGCRGGDGVRSEARIAEVIAALEADIVGLQELDLNRVRSGRVDQAALIAASLGWQGYFHPAVKREDQEYGDAILSRFPLDLRRAQELPVKAPWFCRESRGAMWATAATPMGPCHIVNTHLGLGRRERLGQAALLAGGDWLGGIPDEPLILTGDFNCGAASSPMRLLAGTLGQGVPLAKSPPAFPSKRPFLALDHILVNRHFRILRLSAVATSLTRTASDHLPVLAELSWQEAAGSPD